MSEKQNIIAENLINLDLRSETKEEVIKELAALLFAEKKISSESGFIECVEKREMSMSTYCGFDVAIPHAVSSSVDEVAFAFGRSKGFLWGEEDGVVKFIFLLAIPELTNKNISSASHIDMMSAVAQLALNENVRKKWAEAKSKKEILESFKQEQTNKL